MRTKYVKQLHYPTYIKGPICHVTVLTISEHLILTGRHVYLICGHNKLTLKCQRKKVGFLPTI